MYRLTTTELPLGAANPLRQRADHGAGHVVPRDMLAETLWQLSAGEHTAALTCHEDVSGSVRVVSAPDLLHYMRGWLVEEVARYARRCGWRLAFVA